MTSEVTRLLAEIRAEAMADKVAIPANPVAIEIEAATQKHRTPDQIAAHRNLYRQAKLHVEKIDAWNAANPEKTQLPYLPPMLAYLGAFSYVEKDT